MASTTLPGRSLLRRLGNTQLSKSGERRAVPPVRGLTPVVLLLAAWTLVGSADSFSYPPPGTWLAQLWKLHQAGLIVPALLGTLRTFAIGLALATCVGVMMGFLVGSIPLLDRALTPMMDFFRSLPPPAVISVILLIVGIGYSSALLMVTIGALWPVLLNTAAGVRSIPPLRSDVVRTLRLTRSEQLRKVMLPSLVPNIMLGVKVSVSVAFVVALFIEILGVTTGLGSLLANRQQRFDAAGTWGILFLIGICGYLLNAGIASLERRLLRNWPVAN